MLNDITNEDVKINEINLPDRDEEKFREYLESEGKVIGKINLILLELSGPSIEGKADTTVSWLGKIGNSLHFKTREWVVTNMLLFREGDILDVDKINESERLLRSSGFFLDARIRVGNHNNFKDSVEIDVITKDKWTFTFLFSYDTKNKNSLFGFRDDNLIGLGHILDATVTHDQDKSVGWGGKINYTAINVGGTYFNTGIYFESNKSFDIQSINLTRPFLSTYFEWAGGIDLTWEHGKFEYLESTSNPITVPYKLNLKDFWISKSFPLWFGSGTFKKSSKIVTSARASITNYDGRKDAVSISNKLFENNSLYLFSTGFINLRFYKDIYISSFGITEDIPLAGYISLTAGIEKREFSQRWYAGFDAVYSRRINNIGYFSGKLNFGSFRNINEWEQAALNLNLVYHSPLLLKDKWKFRFLLANDYLFGFNRLEGEQLYLDTENGLRGINRFSLFGKRKILFNIETLIFSPYAPLGFVIGGIVFSDLGLITDRDRNILNSKVYQSYGIGFRINNEAIARANFEVSLVYNPFTSNSSTGDLKILFIGKFLLGSRPFEFGRPSIIPFNGSR